MGLPLFWTDPSSSTDTGGSRSIIKYGTAFTAKNDQDAKVYGNVDWVNTDGDIRLSWWGPAQRYHTYNMYQNDASGFSTLAKHGAIWQDVNSSPAWYKYWRITGADSGDSTPLCDTAIYYNGELIKDAPDRVFGCGIAIDPDPDHTDNIYLIAICGDDSADAGHSSPGTSVYAAAWNNGSPGTWSSALDTQAYSGTNTQTGSPQISRNWSQNLDPWFGNGAGTLYKSFRFDDGTHFTRGVQIMSVTISFPTPGDPPAAVIANEGLAWSSSPEIHAIDYDGSTELTLEDDGTTIYWSDGTNDYDVLSSAERNRGLGDPSVQIMSCDLRARAFLLTKTLRDGDDIAIDRQVVVRTVIDGSTIVNKIINSTV